MSNNSDENSISSYEQFTTKFGQDGCQVLLKNGNKCGEQQTLQICREFNQMYADKLSEIESIGGGDSIRVKMHLQDSWIKDLIAQNEELINAFERLEYECLQRVTILEDKLSESVKCGYQVMQKYKDLDLSININKSFQRVRFLENDLNNLIEFIRRVRDESLWSIQGLQFYEVDCDKLIATKNKNDLTMPDECTKMDYVEELTKKEKLIEELRAEVCEWKDKCTHDGYVTLKKSMLDMRDALTAEVADKHDLIITLRRDIQLLEDQCRRADQQTHFKDDIIKELRKEIKHYKQKVVKEGKSKPTYEEQNAINKRLELDYSKRNVQCKGLQSSVDTICKQIQCSPDTKQKNLQANELKEPCDSRKKFSVNEKSVQYTKKLINRELQCKPFMYEKCEQTECNEEKCQTSLQNITSQVKECITSSLCKLCTCDTNLVEIVNEIQKGTEKEFENVQVIIDKLLKQLQEKDKKLLNQCETINDLITKLATCNDVLTRLESKTALYLSDEENEELRIKLTDAQQENKELRESVIEAKKQIARLQSDIDKYLSENANLQCENDKNLATLKGSTKIYQEKMVELESVKKEKCVIEEKLACICQERDRLLTNQKCLEDMKQTNANLRKELDDTKSKYQMVQKDKKKDNVKDSQSQTKTDPTKCRNAVSLDSVSKKVQFPGKNQKNLNDAVKNLSRSVSQIIETTCKSYSDEDIAQIKADAVETERSKRKTEVTNLKRTIIELEKALKHSQERGSNLQNAVDLYINSVQVLEESEQRNKTEIQQQQITINNLQTALIDIKQKYEEIQQKTTQDIEKQQEALKELYGNLYESQNLITIYYNQYVEATDELKIVRDELKNLQDLILDLEVEKFNNLQDLSMLETRLLKYQFELKSNEACRCGLTDELRKLRMKNQKLEQMICFLQNELGKCKTDLAQLEKVLESGTLVEQEHQKFVQTITELQSALHLVQTQLNAKTKEILREKKISDINTNRIEELQGIISQKTFENNKLQTSLNDIKRELDLTVLKMKGQQNTIRDLENKYENSQKNNKENCAQSHVCQQEITACLYNLQSLKEKIKVESEMLEEKTLQYDDLKNIHAELLERFERLSRKFDKAETEHNEEILSYKHTLRELSENLNRTETNLLKITEDYGIAQKAIEDANEREVLLRQEFNQREHNISDKLHLSQNEEMRLIDYTTTLENELVTLKDIITGKEKQIESAKNNLNKLKCNCSAKINVAQEEINGLKNEINVLMQRQTELLNENDDLTAQVLSLKNNAQLMQSRNDIVREQMDHCLIEIHRIQIEKDNLQMRNDELQKDIKSLYCAFNDMNKEYQCKSENVLMELTDIKISRDEICSESKNVLQNVRLWVQEQKKINNKLCGKLREKNNQIARLRQEKNALANTVKHISTAAPLTDRGKKYSRNNRQLQDCSWGGSQGSTSTDRDSPINRNVEVEWYTYMEKPTDTSEEEQVMWLPKNDGLTVQEASYDCNWQCDI